MWWIVASGKIPLRWRWFQGSVSEGGFGGKMRVGLTEGCGLTLVIKKNVGWAWLGCGGLRIGKDYVLFLVRVRLEL